MHITPGGGVHIDTPINTRGSVKRHTDQNTRFGGAKECCGNEDKKDEPRPLQFVSRRACALKTIT